MKAVVLTTYGDPATGLEYRDVPEPEKPGVGQVLVGVEFAPINFSDILVARGLYPLRPDLPSVIGNEGVGRVPQTISVGAFNVFSCPSMASVCLLSKAARNRCRSRVRCSLLTKGRRYFSILSSLSCSGCSYAGPRACGDR
jgi:Zn-dependent alcohol dehydrogenase